MGCFALIPRFDTKFTKEESECLLPQGHKGYHLNKLRSGKYLSWGGNGCDDDCDWCGECFNWTEILEEEALLIIEGKKENLDD